MKDHVMADDKKKRGAQDRALIALSESYEVAYWSKKFKVTPAKLKAAVKKVGHSAKKVEAHFKEQRHRAADRARIAIHEPYEVRYWSTKFKVTPCTAQGRGGRGRAFLEEGRGLLRGQEEEKDRQEKEDCEEGRQEDRTQEELSDPVIASEAKQSIVRHTRIDGLLRRCRSSQ
jgi:hypothetical protein